MLMLKRVKIQGYKSLVDMEVKLQPLSVLFGPNAAGKSNFLDALQLLARIATSGKLKDAFAPPYRGTPLESFSFGADGIQGLLTKEKISFSIEVDIELSSSVLEHVNIKRRENQLFIENTAREIQALLEPRSHKNKEDDEVKTAFEILPPITHRNIRYIIEVQTIPQTGILKIVDEYLIALDDKGEPVGELLSPGFGPDEKDRYRNDTEYSFLSTSYSTLAYPYLVAVCEELGNWLFFYLEPRERMRMSTPVKEVRHIGLMGEELAAFLNTLRALDEPQFKAVEKALHLLIPSITGIDVSVNNRGHVALSLMQGKTALPADVLSEGTLRILGLLALGGAKEPPTLLGFEEPENGIHPDRLDLVATLLKTLADSGTQVIVTTHSPTLLDLLPEESLYVFQFEKDRTIVNPFSEQKGRRRKRHKSNSSAVEETPVSELLLRGDLYA
jgi:predicted ATPase